jgi:ABC-type dipeptide/oligopeptide/nickel transport system permease component
MSSTAITSRTRARGRARGGGAIAAARFLASRLGQSALVVIGAVLISFVLVSLSGNAIRAHALLLTPEQTAELERQLGFDRPLLERFVEYLGNVLHGDFGESLRFSTPALNLVTGALPNTLLLVGCGLAAALAVGMPAALYGAARPGSRADRAIGRVMSVFQGVPEFWLGLMLAIVFSVQLGWFPSTGFDGPSSVVLPTIAIATPMLPAVYRLLRGELLDVMQHDFVEALRIKGLSERQVVVRHALRNALPGFVTYLILQSGYLIGGTLIVEVVFGWPGIGTLMVDAARERDLGVVQAVVVVVACAYVALNLLADLLVLWLDPRVRTGRR